LVWLFRTGAKEIFGSDDLKARLLQDRSEPVLQLGHSGKITALSSLRLLARHLIITTCAVSSGGLPRPQVSAPTGCPAGDAPYLHVPAQLQRDRRHGRHPCVPSWAFVNAGRGAERTHRPGCRAGGLVSWSWRNLRAVRPT